MSGITISRGVRSNLLALQSIASDRELIQGRLASGKKVNSALDNPTNFFTSASLNARANDLGSLLDSMSNGIKTLEAADNGLKSITRTVESLQSSIRQARQDKSFKSGAYKIDGAAIGNVTTKNLSFSGGSIGAVPVDIALNSVGASPEPLLTGSSNFVNLDVSAGQSYSFDVAVDGGPPVFVNLTTGTADTNTDGAVDLSEAVVHTNDRLALFGSDIRARNSLTQPGRMEFYIASGTHTGPTSSISISNMMALGGGASPIANMGFGGGATANGSSGGGTGGAKSVDQLVADINGNSSLQAKVRASNDNGRLRIENLSTSAMTLAGIGGDGEIDGTVGTGAIGGNDVRADLIRQFNDLRQQLDRTAEDASFNGINLLRGDALGITFNETGSSSLTIQSKGGKPINSTNLGIDVQALTAADADSSLDAILGKLTTALGSLRSQSSSFGSNLSMVQNRQDFTRATMNTLRGGADNLVLADQNEEGANLLALNTRAQLATSALSFASQGDQQVLQFLR
ncbi:MAG: hypothetical protein JNK84_17105 [Phreatobacter sp.]|uniref:flagellin N-terminal helical domain-containing protein n=1 Tax=Phreatobacter sp. TaxID=1966341 RepID=UPI001A3FCF06|nr:flagellin [Phreatobacter sp.]MBL8570792.1 hypothetical protein [Phreatobacter sp.]